MKNCKSACSLRVSTWMTIITFKWRVRRHHLVVKHGLSLCLWKCYCILFLLVWHVTMDDERFVTDDFFFFLLIFSLFQRKCLFVFFFNFSPCIFLLFIFILGPFRKVFCVFNLVIIIFFSNLFLILWFLIIFSLLFY